MLTSCVVSAANAEAVCISTILIALPAFMQLQISGLGVYFPPVQMFHLLGGNIPVYKETLPLLPKDSKVWALVSAKPDMIEFQVEVRKSIYKEPFEQLMQWRAKDEKTDHDSQEAYEWIFGFIGCILARIDDGEDPRILRRMLYTLPTFVSATYVTRLTEKNPRALVILAYWFSLLKSCDGVWWMRGIAEREVFGIQSILPEEWQWAMAWPLQKLTTFASNVTPPMTT